jgi:hypothetical protein
MGARLAKAAANIIDTTVRVFHWWFQQIARQDTLRAKLVVISVGLLALCVICSVPVSLVNGPRKAAPVVASAPTARPTAVEADAPTARPIAVEADAPTVQPTAGPATKAPEPTATAIPPTATSAPTEAPTAIPATATSKPTELPTATPKVTDAERQLVLTIAGHLSDIGKALGNIGTLAQNYENTDDWKISMAAEIVQVQFGHQAIVDLKVPTKIKPLKQAVVRATTDCNNAMTALISGLDHNNARDIQKATALMQL